MTVHLSILLFWPLAAGVIGGLLPRGASGFMGVLGALVPLVLAVILLVDFDASKAGLQYVTDDAWIPDLGIRYKLGIDGLNLWLVGLTTLLFAAVALWTALRPPERSPGLYGFHIGLAETAVLGAFVAQDLALFVLFFDLMLVPFYFLIGMWGGPDRVAATFKLVVYTLVGSLLMLAAAVATAVLSSQQGDGHPLSFVLSDLARISLPESTQKWIFVAFALAFLIKMPAFPVHGWMPDGYRNMPLPVLVLFSGVLSKVAAYGFLRVVMPLFPQAVASFQEIVLLIALASILYGSALAFTQTNARLILGYSSMAQLGFITLGIFALDGAVPGRPGRRAADGQPRPRGRAAVLHRRAAGRARRRLGRHPRDGRHRVPRAGARHAVPDRRAGDAGDAGLVELRRRVLHPDRALQHEDRLLDRRVHRRGDGVRLHAADVHPHDAQPPGRGRRVA